MRHGDVFTRSEAIREVACLKAWSRGACQRRAGSFGIAHAEQRPRQMLLCGLYSDDADAGLARIRRRPGRERCKAGLMLSFAFVEQFLERGSLEALASIFDASRSRDIEWLRLPRIGAAFHENRHIRLLFRSRECLVCPYCVYRYDFRRNGNNSMI